MEQPIKVTYLQLPAFGESIRMLLAYGGTQFDDVRIPMRTWLGVKNNYFFGQVPVYEENGKVVNQTLAILRYLGKKFNLMGNNDWENLEIDAIADTIKDLIIKLIPGHYTKSASQQKQFQEVLLKETLPFYMEKLDKIAKENNGYMALKRLTWVDFYVAGALDYFISFPFIKTNLWEANPNLKAVRENVLSIPAVREWHRENPTDQEALQRWYKVSGTPFAP